MGVMITVLLFKTKSRNPMYPHMFGSTLLEALNRFYKLLEKTHTAN